MLPPGNKKPPESSKDQAFGFYVNMPSLFKLLFLVFIVVPLLASLGYCYLYLLNFWSEQAENIVMEDPNLIIEEDWVELEKKMENEADFYPTCSSNMFNCTVTPWNNKTVSLPWMRRCDGVKNCWDGSDEKNCLECLTSFSCKAEDGIHSICLQGIKLCDSVADCPDASDETKYCNLNRTCTEEEFGCVDEQEDGNRCFPKSFLCDGDYYCRHYYYECDSCEGYSRQCQSKFSGRRCISVHEMCDGSVDCADHRDEKFFHCNETLGDCPGQCPIKNKNNDFMLHFNIDEKIKSMVGITKNIRCSDNNWYNPLVGCSGEYGACDGHCLGCMPNSFQCKKDKKCISVEKVCDGKIDCSDEIDEKNCNETLSQCDSENNRCNGFCNCLDDCRDEKNCIECKEDFKLKDYDLEYYPKYYPQLYNRTSKLSWLGYQAHAFFCHKGQKCIPVTKRCDGRPDCSDGEDEENCECFECMMHPHQTYVCQEGKRCFRFNEVCDENFESQCPNATKLDVEHCELLRVKSDQIKLY